MRDVTLAVGRLVHNLAVERKVSKEAAIFLIECELSALKREAPKPPDPPAVEVLAA